MKLVNNVFSKTVIAATLICSTAVMAAPPKYSANIPESLLTPDVVDTRIGQLKFNDGTPSHATVEMVYDNLDFYRGVDTFLTGIPAASVWALMEGMKEVGMDKYSLGLYEEMLDARSLWLTPNTTTLYGLAEIDTKMGPVVMEVPAGVLGPIANAYFEWAGDIGFTGPDKGQGGKYLFIPPNYQGDVPAEGYHVVHTNSYRHALFMRAFVIDNDIPKTVQHVKDNWRLYPYSKAENPPQQHFVDLTHKQYNTIHANDFNFYEELNNLVQYEADSAFSDTHRTLWAGVGIQKGKDFAPDERMKEILTESAAVANATARAMSYKPRHESLFGWEDRQWTNPFYYGGHEFAQDGVVDLEARTFFHYMAIGVTPAMANPQVGQGSVYAFTATDNNGEFLTGDNVYSVTLPANIPAQNFWSFNVYSNQTRSLLETDQIEAGLDSLTRDIQPNADGSYTIWFSANAPEGKESNWVQTMPGKTWSTILRLYSPEQEWFDKSWIPGDIIKHN